MERKLITQNHNLPPNKTVQRMSAADVGEGSTVLRALIADLDRYCQPA
jgi:hypothetical protein